MENLYDSLKQNHLFGPSAVIFGQLIITILQNACCMPELDGELYTHGVMAAFLTGVYIYSWSTGNPHLAEPVTNLPVYELCLTIAAGYYASNIFSSLSCAETIHDIISIMAISGLLTDGKGANVFATYVFLVEIATIFFLMRDCAIKYNHPCKQLMDLIYPIVLISARTLGLWHLTYMIMTSTLIPVIHKVESVILTLCSFHFVQQSLSKLGESRGSQSRRSRENVTRIRVSSRTSGRRRSRSSSRLASRTRSRSRIRSNSRIRRC